MSVGVFYSSIANPQKFSNKTALMDNFRDGALRHNERVVEFKDHTLPTPDIKVGFVLGYTLEKNFRRQLIDTLQSNGSYVVFVDSNIMHYARQEHEWHRYSLNSVYPSDGIYLLRDLDRTKWDKFSAWHNAPLKQWREDGNHILILCQRETGWNLFGNNQNDWFDATVKKIRAVTDRPIRVRPHPNDRKRFEAMDRVRAVYGNAIEVSTADNIRKDLVNCWCSVGYNSTPNAVSIIEGVPVCLTDPDNSWAGDVAFTDYSLLETPYMPDREEWKHKIANIHWSNEEVRNGDLWDAIKQYTSSVR